MDDDAISSRPPKTSIARRTYKISESSTVCDTETSDGELLASMLNDKDFPTVMKIVEKYKDGVYTILPYLTKIQSPLETINPYNLTKCCRTKTLILPNCNIINDNMLMMLPQLESLTVKAGSLLTGDPFSCSSSLKTLQIISHNKTNCDTLLTPENIRLFSNLEMLHVMNTMLTDECFRWLPNLRILILEESPVTPKILNYLKLLEICIVNKKLYKYVSSIKNKLILEKIGKLHKIQIYALENHIIL